MGLRPEVHPGPARGAERPGTVRRGDALRLGCPGKAAGVLVLQQRGRRDPRDGRVPGGLGRVSDAVRNGQGAGRPARRLGPHGAGQLPGGAEPARGRGVEAAVGDGAQAEGRR